MYLPSLKPCLKICHRGFEVCEAYSKTAIIAFVPLLFLALCLEKLDVISVYPTTYTLAFEGFWCFNMGGRSILCKKILSI
jgi:hypothetical protein